VSRQTAKTSHYDDVYDRLYHGGVKAKEAVRTDLALYFEEVCRCSVVGVVVFVVIVVARFGCYFLASIPSLFVALRHGASQECTFYPARISRYLKLPCPQNTSLNLTPHTTCHTQLLLVTCLVALNITPYTLTLTLVRLYPNSNLKSPRSPHTNTGPSRHMPFRTKHHFDQRCERRA
jgi:hypothetical protein